MSLTFVVGILKDGEKFLAEQRQPTESYFPNAVIFPGGHIDEGESPEHALAREMNEELDISISEHYFLGEFIYPDGAKSLVFLITLWKGDPKSIEAQRLVWIDSAEQLTNELDRTMFERARSFSKEM